MIIVEKVQRFGHWEWVAKRQCVNGHVTRIIAGDTRRAPSLGVGAIRCSQCEALVRL